MKRFIGVVMAALGLWVLSASAASATSFTVSPWAYACGNTVYGNPVTQQDNPGEASCKSSEPGLGNAGASYTGGQLTLHKDGPQADDLASGATISGLATVSTASYYVKGYCGAGAPRLNVVSSDGATHFYGCSAHYTDGHVTVDFSKDDNGGGIAADDAIKSIDFVFDETSPAENGQATAVLSNLSFEGSPAPTPTPTATPTPPATASATAHPSATARALAPTGGGRPASVPWAMPVGVGLMLVGGLLFVWRRRGA